MKAKVKFIAKAKPKLKPNPEPEPPPVPPGSMTIRIERPMHAECVICDDLAIIDIRLSVGLSGVEAKRLFDLIGDWRKRPETFLMLRPKP